MAGTFTAVDLSRLAFPNAIEVLDYEAILADMLAQLVQLAPEFTALVESDPAYKILEVAAFREMLVRQRVNEAVKAVSLAYAKGADLDQIGARFGVERLLLDEGDADALPPVPPTYEDDESMRRRVQLSLEGYSTAGPEGAYIYHALSVPDVLDVAVDSPEPGKVVVSVLSRTGDGTASADLQAAVEAKLNSDDVRPLTDDVNVEAGGVVPYTVAAQLVMFDGPDSNVVLAEAQAAMEDYASRSHRLGRNITLSGIYAALHRDGVQRVILTSPVADVVTARNEAPHCVSISLEYGGSDE